MTRAELEKLCDQVLFDSVPQGLRDAIDRLLGRGVNAEGLKDFVRLCARRAGAHENCLTVLAADTYIEWRVANPPDACTVRRRSADETVTDQPNHSEGNGND